MGVIWAFAGNTMAEESHRMMLSSQSNYSFCQYIFRAISAAFSKGILTALPPKQISYVYLR